MVPRELEVIERIPINRPRHQSSEVWIGARRLLKSVRPARIVGALCEVAERILHRGDTIELTDADYDSAIEARAALRPLVRVMEERAEREE